VSVLHHHLRALVLDNKNQLSVVPHQISSLLNLTRLSIGLPGEVRKEGINILARLLNEMTKKEIQASST